MEFHLNLEFRVEFRWYFDRIWIFFPETGIFVNTPKLWKKRLIKERYIWFVIFYRIVKILVFLDPEFIRNGFRKLDGNPEYFSGVRNIFLESGIFFWSPEYYSGSLKYFIPKKIVNKALTDLFIVLLQLNQNSERLFFPSSRNLSGIYLEFIQNFFSDN